MKANPFDQVIVKCCCSVGEAVGCQCGPIERVLRTYMNNPSELPPMNPTQREWCLLEIKSVEGYNSKEHETDTDAQLARTVLSAWMDYCRDKGML